MKLIITGRPVSKKNSKQIIRRGRRTYLVPSDAHSVFHVKAKNEIKKQMTKRYKGAVMVNYILHQKGKLTQDFDNAIGSINDLLQDCEVIENDKYITGGNYLILSGEQDFFSEVEIIQ